MANIDGNEMRWNGKLSGAVDLLYYNKENVDVVQPPYAGRDRNSSFFLKTRKGYQCDNFLLDKLHDLSDEEWRITDMKILWNDSCTKDEGYVYYYCEGVSTHTKQILIRKIEGGCLNETEIKETAKKGRHGCVCSDEKLFVTTYVKGPAVYFIKDATFAGVAPRKEIATPSGEITAADLMFLPAGATAKYKSRTVDKSVTKWQRVVVVVTVGIRSREYTLWVRVRTRITSIDAENDTDEDATSDSSNEGIQINRKEGGVVRGYITDQGVIDGDEQYTNIAVGDYVVAYGSENKKDSGFCGQVRTIVGKNKKGELVLNAPWLGFSDKLDENDEVRGTGVSYKIFHEYGEVIGFATYDGVEIITNPWPSNRAETLAMCDFHRVTSDAGCIISTASDVDRVYFLYENGYIRYGEKGMNKFFTLTENSLFAGTDKSAITIYRDMILAFGKRKIAVGLWDDSGTYAQMYNQSASIGLKNRYAYGEYNGDMLFVSNDNRLLALQFESNVGTHMLNFQDVGAYANPFIKAMLPSDEAYIGVDNNELRIFIESKSDIDRDTNNSKTTILKYNTIFQTWTVDILKYFKVIGCYEGVYFGDNVYYRDGYVDRHLMRDDIDNTGYTNIDRDYQVNISAYLLENEENGMANNTAGALDLFRIASLQKLMILLGTGRYSDELTKIKITERRGGWGREYEINSLEENDWIKLITYAYNKEQLSEEFLKKKECVIDSLNDGSSLKRTRCKEGHKLQDPIQQYPWCEHTKDVQLGEHNVCINDEVYELAPTMPLTIQLGDQENYNTEIKIELISQNGDVINFGGFMALLHLATLGQNMGGDGEYQIKVDPGC